MLGRPDQARDAPVDRRGRHQDLRRRQRAARGDLPQPPRAGERRRARRAGRGRRRHASVLALGRPDHLARRPLRQHRRGTAAAGAVASDFRPARARRRAGSVGHDRSDERGALLPAALAGALDQLAVLDGPRHRPEVVPHDDLSPLPAHRRPRPLRLLERVRELHPAARRSEQHRRCEEDLVGRQAASDVRDARVPRLRRADAAGDGGHARRAGPGHRGQALPPAHSQPGLPALPPRAHRREQVARRALRPRRQAHRLRPPRRGADARPRGRAARVHRRRRRRPGEPAGGGARAYRARARARAPISSWRCSARRAISRRSCTT